MSFRILRFLSNEVAKPRSFFFFQAEDGIRDADVTGVQACALPILPSKAKPSADVKGQEHVAPEGLGLRAIAEGFALLGIPDEERLNRQFPVYDALYAYASRQAG